MNVVCTGDGRFVEVQGTAEGAPFDRAELDGLLDLPCSAAPCSPRPSSGRWPPRRPVSGEPRGHGRPAGSGPRLVLATRNAHKVTELVRLLRPSAPALADRRRTGRAGVRAGRARPAGPRRGGGVRRDVRRRTRCSRPAPSRRPPGCPRSRDDSGLCVAVLGGAPGVFSARWAGRHGDDAANLAPAAGPARRRPAAAPGARGSSARPRSWTPVPPRASRRPSPSAGWRARSPRPARRRAASATTPSSCRRDRPAPARSCPRPRRTRSATAARPCAGLAPRLVALLTTG